ncbi:MAG: cellulose biosynthesis protein CelD, partial [Verrucomicrobiaceae bacterium]|nr:cellulose biosynthesis protein CelD [Verrucomicrobiaceae bacterium]
DVIELPTVHGDSPNLPLLRQALSKFAQAGERQPMQTCYYMALPASWDDQLAAWKSKERCIFRSKWRKMTDEHAGRPLQGGRDLPVNEAFAHLWRLHGLRFKTEHSLFLNEESRAFHTRLIERWSPLGRVLLPLLALDGSITAARYGIAYGGTYWSFQAGYDPAYSQLSIGKLSLGWTAQCAIEQGLTSMDHLPGGGGYKEEWSTHTRTVYHLEAWHPFNPASLLFRSLRALKRRHDHTLQAPTAEEVPA